MKIKIWPLSLFTIVFLAGACSVKHQATIVRAEKPIEQYGKFKKFSEVIPTGTKANPGLFDVYKVGGKYYFVVPDSLLGREMMVLTRLVKTPANLHVVMNEYGGEQENEQIWKWEKHDNQLFIKLPIYTSKADSGTAMYQAVQNSNLPTILAAFTILAADENGHGYVIDVTDLYNSELAAIGISDELKKAFKIGALDVFRSYIDTVRSFPTNIETREIKTYRAALSPTDNSTGAITFELNTSMLLLPKTPMKPRLLDPRVSYMSQDIADYGQGLQVEEPVSYITRWRLEPKDEAAYERGELVEPKKPIIIYIDPATPPKWVPYLIAGINDWQKAFEAAGFKNAIIGKPAPTLAEDSTFSMEDARYTVLRYFASDMANAYGQHNSDPRTGEIVESYVGWYSNQLKDLYDWYFIQTAAANPLARRPVLPDELMGELVRYTCSHEIGHSLGLPHNWGSNYAYPTDSLRSRSFTNKHGTAASIMDYSRFNYVAQPGDGVVQFSPKIGEYDIWAIKWGYTWFPPTTTIIQEKEILDKLTAERANNPLYFWGKEFTNYDPRTQNEDIGDDAMKAGTYGIANLKRILPNIELWTSQKGKDLSELDYIYNQLIDQFKRYNGHVLTNIGGMYVNHKTSDQTDITGFAFVDKATQHDAVLFLDANVFYTPLWLIDEQELKEFDNGIIIDRIKNLQGAILAQLFAPSRLARMFDNNIKNGKNAYTLDDLFNDVRPAIFNTAKPDAFMRTLERKYIEVLGNLLIADPQPEPSETTAELAAHGHTPVNVPLSDIRPLVRAELKKINKVLPVGKDETSMAHFVDMHVRIGQSLMAIKNVVNISPSVN